MHAPVTNRGQDFQTALMHNIATQRRTEEAERELRSAECCNRINRIAGLTIAGIGFTGTILTPLMVKSFLGYGAAVVVGLPGSLVFFGVMGFGLWIADPNTNSSNP